MTTPDFIIKQFDTGRALSMQLLTTTVPYTPIDLTGKQAYMDWRRVGDPDTAKQSLQLAIANDPTTGIVTRNFDPADVAVFGMREMVVRLVDASNRETRFPTEGYYYVLIDKAI